jgi:hypothetical protein
MGGPGVLYIGVVGSLSVKIASTRRGERTDVLESSKLHSRKSKKKRFGPRPRHTLQEKVGRKLQKTVWAQNTPPEMDLTRLGLKVAQNVALGALLGAMGSQPHQ